MNRQAVSRERLHRVGRTRHECVYVLLGIEPRQHVVGDRTVVAAAGAADADPQAQEVLRAERLRQRAEPVVARKAAAGARLEATRLEIDVVMDDQQRLRLDLEEPRRSGDRPAGDVGVGGGSGRGARSTDVR